MAIDKFAAQNIAQEFCRLKYHSNYEKISIVEDATVESISGWVFIFQTKEYISTGKEEHKSLGPPVFVSIEGGAEFVPTYLSIERWLAQRNS